ncbi:MAG: hypothetical protein VB099_11895 [Candidatus Limiplasma sp.]|nr:hypothetical protein [Candidatus Limiplasma sp.]
MAFVSAKTRPFPKAVFSGLYRTRTNDLMDVNDVLYYQPSQSKAAVLAIFQNGQKCRDIYTLWKTRQTSRYLAASLQIIGSSPNLYSTFYDGD